MLIILFDHLITKSHKKTSNNKENNMTSLLHLLIGCVLSVPYAILMNGNLENFLDVAWIAPLASVILGIAWETKMFIMKREVKAKVVFWYFAALFSLPILLSWTSYILNSAGYADLGHLSLFIRNDSMMVVFTLTMLSLYTLGLIFWVIGKARSARSLHCFV